MKNLKFLIIGVFAAMLFVGCGKNADPSATTKVSLSMTVATSSGKPIINGRVTSSTVISLSDVKVNVKDIKFDFDQEGHHNDSTSADNNNDDGDHNDGHHENDSIEFNDGHQDEHDSSFVDNNDSKLNGPFIVDLMHDSSFVNQVITSINLPNAKFEKVRFKLVASTDAGDMNGKSILITGTIDGTPFVFWHNHDASFKARFQDSTTLVTNGSSIDIAIQLELGKILSAVNGGVDLSNATDGNKDGTITIDPLNTDGNKDLADAIMRLLVRHTHCHQKHEH